MNSRISRLFVAITENRVVVAETNLSSFVAEMKSIDAGIRSLSYYERHFKDDKIIYHTTSLGKTYTLQRVL